MWEFPKLQPALLLALKDTQKSIRDYIMKTDEDPTLSKLYYHGIETPKIDGKKTTVKTIKTSRKIFLLYTFSLGVL